MGKSAVVQESTSYEEARAFVEERGILPGRDGYTKHQLTEELLRQGWGWTLDSERAEATKADPPSPAAERTFVAQSNDPIANLMIVLADAIRFDEERGIRPMLPYEPDIAARTRNGTIVAAIEAKNSRLLSQEVAVAFRHNLWTDGPRALRAPFFMVVSQEAGYLWDQRGRSRADAPPTLAFSMRPVIERYASWLEPDEWLYKEVFEQIVARWLNDLADTRTGTPQPIASELAETEFLDFIQNTRMIFLDDEA
ncbi:MAG: hypothetical protein M3464_00685 [Chloroflexota bacterium]|nr:hypothetical protein [Chloroflexota bacterium]